MTRVLRAELSGNIWNVLRDVGDVLEEQDVVLVIETMKMEIPVLAGSAGTLTEVRVAAGQQVAEGDVLAVVVP